MSLLGFILLGLYLLIYFVFVYLLGFNYSRVFKFFGVFVLAVFISNVFESGNVAYCSDSDDVDDVLLMQSILEEYFNVKMYNFQLFEADHMSTEVIEILGIDLNKDFIICFFNLNADLDDSGFRILFVQIPNCLVELTFRTIIVDHFNELIFTIKGKSNL
jgi:hypothetical protein